MACPVASPFPGLTPIVVVAAILPPGISHRTPHARHQSLVYMFAIDAAAKILALGVGLLIGVSAATAADFGLVPEKLWEDIRLGLWPTWPGSRRSSSSSDCHVAVADWVAADPMRVRLARCWGRSTIAPTGYPGDCDLLAKRPTWPPRGCWWRTTSGRRRTKWHPFSGPLFSRLTGIYNPVLVWSVFPTRLAWQWVSALSAAARLQTSTPGDQRRPRSQTRGLLRRGSAARRLAAATGLRPTTILTRVTDPAVQVVDRHPAGPTWSRLKAAKWQAYHRRKALEITLDRCDKTMPAKGRRDASTIFLSRFTIRRRDQTGVEQGRFASWSSAHHVKWFRPRHMTARAAPGSWTAAR